MRILVLNSGSSSEKACLYEIGEMLPEHPPVPLWARKIEWSGDAAAMIVKTRGEHSQREIAGFVT
jgi:acetate kinase